MSRIPLEASGWPTAIAPPIGVDPRVVVGDAEVVEERQHLDREGLVDLEQADVVDGQAALAAPSPWLGTGPSP
jgi:hypothetical protein